MFKTRNLSKKFMVLLICGLLLCSIQACSASCTAVYVGPEVSADGSTIIARCNDHQGVWGNHITVTPRVENKSGRLMAVCEDGSVKAELPATTYKYTATPYMNSTKAYIDEEVNDAAACTNEYGVAMTMSVTAYPNNATLEADPYVEKGLCEDAATDLVICQSKTAREAVEVLCGIIDKYGSKESNIAIIADQKEAWYVEIYGGHQYAAVKLPADKAAAFGNEYTLEYLSDYEDNITSKELTSLPKEKGFAVYGKNGEMNLLETYSGNETILNTSRMRTWMGHQILAPSKFSRDYNNSTVYPLTFAPDKKVSAEDVCQLLRNRYEGTKYSPDETKRIDMRVIGTDTSLSAHVIQIYPDLPADMSCVSWVSSGPPLYGVFVPVSNDCVNISEAYGANQPVDDEGVFDTDKYPYYVFKDLCTRCVGPDNYKIYGQPIQAYWKEAESNMFDGMPKVIGEAQKIKDNDKRANYITSYCNQMQTYAFEDGKELLNGVVWAQNENSNTVKLEKDNLTHQLTGKRVVIPRLNVTLDASRYKNVPAVP